MRDTWRCVVLNFIASFVHNLGGVSFRSFHWSLYFLTHRSLWVAAVFCRFDIHSDVLMPFRDAFRDEMIVLMNRCFPFFYYDSSLESSVC